MRNVHQAITVGCIVISILVLVGTVSAFFSPGMQAALTIPSTHKMTPTASLINAVTPTISATRPTLKATTMVPGPSPTAPSTTGILAQDTFQRNDQPLWGMASDGQLWGGNANTARNFSIAGHAGIVSNGLGTFDATLGPRVTDADVVFSGSLNLFGNGTSNIGSVLRWTDTNNWYKAYIDGTQLILIKKVASTVTLLKTVRFPAQNGQVYSLRFRIVGSLLSAKVWPTGQTEPANWMVMATDTALVSGSGGLRVVIQKGTVAKFTMFMEMVARKAQ